MRRGANETKPTYTADEILRWRCQAGESWLIVCVLKHTVYDCGTVTGTIRRQRFSDDSKGCCERSAEELGYYERTFFIALHTMCLIDIY